MDILFEDAKLKKLINDEKKCTKKFGAICTKKIQRRLQNIREAEHFGQLKDLPGRFHALKEDRAGQYAFDLEHPLRLVIRPELTPTNTDPSGYLIDEITTIVIVIEIFDYH
jgi:toxin HigB-1